jgi:thiol-disulfide isomerase/thioredoxin
MNADNQVAWVSSDQDLREMLSARDHVIALFHASWCPFCVRFLPIFQKQAEKQGRRFVIVQDDQETIADPYSVTVYPTVLFFEKGAVSKRLDGVVGVGLDENQLARFVQSCSWPE